MPLYCHPELYKLTFLKDAIRVEFLQNLVSVYVQPLRFDEYALVLFRNILQ